MNGDKAIMENSFSDFYAEVSDKRRVAFDLEDSYGDDEYRYRG